MYRGGTLRVPYYMFLSRTSLSYRLIWRKEVSRFMGIPGKSWNPKENPKNQGETSQGKTGKY